jgi:hypothetical protein
VRRRVGGVRHVDDRRVRLGVDARAGVGRGVRRQRRKLVVGEREPGDREADQQRCGTADASQDGL